MGINEALMTVEMVRLYSPMIGFTRWLRTQGLPGAIFSINSPIRSSWAGLTMDQSRATAITSTS